MSFFEKIGEHIGKVGQDVTAQTKKISDITQLNSSISEKEKRISALYLEIGQVYYEKHKADEMPPEEADKIAEINAISAEISEAREKIKCLKGIVKCKNCGAEILADATFCNACGTRVEHTPSVDETGEEGGCICPVCHEAVEAGNRFCRHCGARVDMNS